MPVIWSTKSRSSSFGISNLDDIRVRWHKNDVTKMARLLAKDTQTRAQGRHLMFTQWVTKGPFWTFLLKNCFYNFSAVLIRKKNYFCRTKKIKKSINMRIETLKSTPGPSFLVAASSFSVDFSSWLHSFVPLYCSLKDDIFWWHLLMWIFRWHSLQNW